MRILLSGLCGHMGAEVVALAKAGYRDAEIVAGVDPFSSGSDIPCAATFSDAEKDVDIIIDFSHHSLTKALCDFAVENNLPLVIATTGQTDEEKGYIAKTAESVPVFYAANYSVGVALLCELAKKTAEIMPEAEIEIVETHHDRKLDAPSGTALAIADAIKTVKTDAEVVCGRSGNGKRGEKEIGIQSIRIGNIVGIHEVLVGTQNQTITLKHEAHSRALFAEGALCAAEFLLGKEPGLYTMNDMVKF
ncbi:MAG: 4-hydroxy-tetrahydrodipicolinate reductase [Clostridia bacterium]|nr:4-hydroxy-tetrahydrodipicolinate reductase [Clostridia bacterium]MBR5015498.1 4-hydroxy-tetrahydrodipicolinate reductase [Clostridia bacterium]